MARTLLAQTEKVGCAPRRAARVGRPMLRASGG